MPFPLKYLPNIINFQNKSCHECVLWDICNSNEGYRYHSNAVQCRTSVALDVGARRQWEADPYYPRILINPRSLLQNKHS